MIKVAYLRDRLGRHSRQVIAIPSRRNLANADAVMAKIGFEREGMQGQLSFVGRKCACGCGELVKATGIHLTGESWIRKCARRVFGGEE